MHKAGFVNIIGLPNVGKSTLLNLLLGDNLSIVTPKPQTTRHRILGIYNDENTQIVFSDTPGFINEPHYQLHKVMNSFIEGTFKDADVVLYVAEPDIKNQEELSRFIGIKKIKCPIICIINKVDLSNQNKLDNTIEHINKSKIFKEVIPVSALYKFNTEKIIPLLTSLLPRHEPYYPKEDLSDRNMRFFVSEIIREKILSFYHKEIPYSTEVLTEEYKEKENITAIKAFIFVERESQKMIILGKNGEAIKKLGISARKDIEKFIDSKVYLDLTVKVLKNWRNDINILKKLGY